MGAGIQVAMGLSNDDRDSVFDNLIECGWVTLCTLICYDEQAMAKLDPQAPATNQTVMDAVEHVVERMSELVDEKLEALDQRIDRRFGEAAADRQELHRKVDDLKADLADTPSRKGLEDMRKRVDRLEAFHHQGKRWMRPPL
jgi:hypothetical protein